MKGKKETRSYQLLYDATSRPITLDEYKRIKVILLKQLGYRVDLSVFSEAKNQIQVDQIAHSIFMGRKKVIGA